MQNHTDGEVGCSRDAIRSSNSERSIAQICVPALETSHVATLNVRIVSICGLNLEYCSQVSCEECIPTVERSLACKLRNVCVTGHAT